MAEGTFPKVDGDVLFASEANTFYDAPKIHKLINEQFISLVSATNSGVLAGSSQKLIDKFLDSNGQNNTVDTGNTTGLYGIIGKYYFDDFTISINASNQNAQATMTSTETTTASLGYIIVPNKSCFLISITKHASEDSNRAIVGEVGVGSLGTASFSGNTATFASPIKLIEGKTYYVNVDKTGSSRTSYKQTTGITYPYTNIYVNFTSSSVNGTAEGGNLARSIVSISTKDVVYTNSLIQSVATTIPTGMTKVFVTPLMYESLATGDSITADVSLDGTRCELVRAKTSTNSGTAELGYMITATATKYIVGAEKDPNCNATRLLLKTSAGSTIATATFSGNTATFSSPQQLTSGTNYKLVCDNSGSSYTGTDDGNNATYPYVLEFINVISDSNSGTTNTYNIRYITMCDNTTHSSYTTGVPINTWTPITSANGTQLIVKANLNTNDGTTTPKVLGWRVLLE